jgi:carboxymethylenebutenolidase
MAGTESIAVGDRTMPMYVSPPTHDPQTAVVVLQEAFGVNDHIREVADRLAGEGHLAVAPHLFHRSGDPELGYDDNNAVAPHVQQLQLAELKADLASALDNLASRGIEPTGTGVIGFCMGGSISLLAGCEWALGASVSYYGGGIAKGRFGMPPLLDLAPTLQTPWLGAFGDLDESIPVDDVGTLRAAAARSGQPCTVVRYPHAGHGFFCDARRSYHEASAVDVWDRTLKFFAQHLF